MDFDPSSAVAVEAPQFNPDTAIPVEHAVADDARKAIADDMAGKTQLDHDTLAQLYRHANTESPRQKLLSAAQGIGSAIVGGAGKLFTDPIGAAEGVYNFARPALSTASEAVKEFTGIGDTPEEQRARLEKPIASNDISVASGLTDFAGRILPTASNLATGAINVAHPSSAPDLDAYSHVLQRAAEQGIEDKHALAQSLGGDPNSALAKAAEFGGWSLLPIGLEAKAAPAIARGVEAAVEGGTRLAGSAVATAGKIGEKAAIPALGAFELAHGNVYGALGTLAAQVLPQGRGLLGNIAKIRHAVVEAPFEFVQQAGNIAAKAKDGQTILETMGQSAETEINRQAQRLDKLRTAFPEETAPAFENDSLSGGRLNNSSELGGKAKEARAIEEKIQDLTAKQKTIERYKGVNQILSDGLKFGLNTGANASVAGGTMAAFAGTGAPVGEETPAAVQGFETGALLGAPGAIKGGIEAPARIGSEALINGAVRPDHPFEAAHQENVATMPQAQQDYINKFSGLSTLNSGKPVVALKPDQMVAALRDEGVNVNESPNGFEGKNVIYANADTLASGSVPHEVIHGTGLDRNPAIVDAVEAMKADENPAIQAQLKTGTDAYNSALRKTVADHEGLTPENQTKEIIAALGTDILKDIPPEALYGGRGGRQLIAKAISARFGKKGVGSTSQFGFPVTPEMKSAMTDALFDLGKKAEQAPTRPVEASQPAEATTTPPEQQNAPSEPVAPATPKEMGIPEILTPEQRTKLKKQGFDDATIAKIESQNIPSVGLPSKFPEVASQEAQEPIGVTAALAEINRRNGRAPEIPTPYNEPSQVPEVSNAAEIYKAKIGDGREALPADKFNTLSKYDQAMSVANLRRERSPIPAEQAEAINALGLSSEGYKRQGDFYISNEPSQASTIPEVRATAVSELPAPVPEVAGAGEGVPALEVTTGREQPRTSQPASKGQSPKTQEESTNRGATSDQVTPENLAVKLKEANASVTDKMRRAKSSEKRQEIARKARLGALKTFLSENDAGLKPVTDEATGEVSYKGDVDPSNPVHKAILDEFDYSPKQIKTIQDLQANKGKSVYLRDYNSAAQAGYEKGGADFTGKQRGEEYKASPTGKAGERQGEVSRQDKPFTPLQTVLTDKGINTFGFDHDKFLSNVRSILDAAKEKGVKTGYEGLKGDQLDDAIAADFRAVSANHAAGYEKTGQTKLQTFPDMAEPRGGKGKPQPVDPDRANVINMAMANEGAKPPNVLRGTTDFAKAKFAKAQDKSKQAIGLADLNLGFRTPEGETNPLREQLSAQGFDAKATLKPPFSNIRPDLIEGGVHDTPGEGKSVHAHGFEIPAKELANEGFPKSDLTAAGFLPASRIETRNLSPERIKELKDDPNIVWHGSPSGELRGAENGLHLGTFEAAKQALESRIGRPKTGEWDGTREYGKTLLDGIGTRTGYSARGGPDHYPEGRAKFGDGVSVPLDSKPVIAPFRITGKMSNTPFRPHEDFKANGMMRGQLKKGNAKSGYYYTNVGEDSGSISAVVPSWNHVDQVRFLPAGEAGAKPGEAANATREWLEKGTDSPYFKRWFGDSKVVDDSGKPIRVFHGTNQPITQFSTDRLGSATKSNSSQSGFFFTSSPDIASEYARNASRRTISDVDSFEAQSERLRKRYESLDKIASRSGKSKDFDDAEKALSEWENYEISSVREDEHKGVATIPVYLKADNLKIIDAKGRDPMALEGGGLTEIIQSAKSQGFDGVKFKNIVDNVESFDPSDHYVVFKPEQIKSATGNTGAFDPKNPDIRFLPASDPANPKNLKSVAIKLSDGSVIHGTDLNEMHLNLLLNVQEQYGKKELERLTKGSTSGWVDAAGNFLDRAKAKKRAIETGQARAEALDAEDRKHFGQTKMPDLESLSFARARKGIPDLAGK